jgi:hypothetical protein
VHGRAGSNPPGRAARRRELDAVHRAPQREALCLTPIRRKPLTQEFHCRPGFPACRWRASDRTATERGLERGRLGWTGGSVSDPLGVNPSKPLVRMTGRSADGFTTPLSATRLNSHHCVESGWARKGHYPRESKDTPNEKAFCLVAPTVLLSDLAILLAGVFCFARLFSSRTSVAVQARLLAFLAISFLPANMDPNNRRQ